MTHSRAMSIIRSRVKSAVGEIPVHSEEEEFEPPDGTPWVRASILPAVSRQTTCGIKNSRHRGVLILSFMQAKNRGDGALWDLLDRVKKSFNMVTVDGITWDCPEPSRPASESNDSATQADDAVRSLASTEAQVNLSCPFKYEQRGDE